MTEDTGHTSAARGDAAYREQKAAIAARNEAARKAGKERRQAEDRKAAVKRAESEHADMAGLRDTFGAR
jgi:rubrerythrin